MIGARIRAPMGNVPAQRRVLAYVIVHQILVTEWPFQDCRIVLSVRYYVWGHVIAGLDELGGT